MKTDPRKRCNGFTIVELMVALLVSSLLTVAILNLFTASNRSYKDTDRSARLQGNARFAIHALKQDLSLVKFFAGVQSYNIVNDGSLGVVSDDCSGAAAAYDYSKPLLAMQSDSSGDAYGCITDAVPDTGVLVIKHARALPLDTTAVENSKTYLLANHEVGVLYDGADTAPLAQVPEGRAWEYLVYVYYIRKDPDAGKPPVLSRKTLRWNGTAMAMQTESIVSGIEEMRLLFGVDSSSDGSLDTFLEAATINASTTYDWDDVGAVQINLLVRTDEEDHFFTDTKTYNLGAGDAVVSPGDHFHRNVIQTTISLRNSRFSIREEG